MEYRKDIDVLKGIAIVAVILYHIGLLPNGYLGVDVFLVINGFLIIPSLIYKVSKNEFNFKTWFEKRIYRVWPIVLVASIASMIIGYFVMIPDDYENLSESVVASNLFANNVLSAVTTRNYWDSANEFKPLMQMWYIGILVQFYLIFPAIIYFCKLCLKKYSDRKNFWLSIVGVLGIISLLLYLIYPTAYSNKFYFVQYRIWEFALGGFIGLLMVNKKITINKFVSWSGFFALCILFLIGCRTLSQIDTITIIGEKLDVTKGSLNELLTTLTVSITAILLLGRVNLLGFGWLGKMSLSLYVWHQIILAFSRYCFVDKFTINILLIYLVVTFAISISSYYLLEGIRLRKIISKWVFFILLIITTVIAFLVYRNAGVVRDVPELGISLSNPFNNRNTEYIDQLYEWPKHFETEKPHVLVMGNSFARDFGCILMEYDKNSRLEKSYASDFNNADKKTIANADYIFIFGSKKMVQGQLFQLIKSDCKVYGIGTKSYGKNFGRFYTQRKSVDYFDQSIPYHPKCDSINSLWEKEWGKDHFIDIMEATQLENGNIRIFTPDHKVISFDCQHLTPDGCKFYATELNLDKIFN